MVADVNAVQPVGVLIRELVKSGGAQVKEVKSNSRRNRRPWNCQYHVETLRNRLLVILFPLRFWNFFFSYLDI